MTNFNFTLSYIEIYLIFINIFSFFFYGFDKLQAIRNSNNNKKISRIPEKKLLFVGLIGGSPGAILSMFLFRHKIKKLSFMLKFILVVFLQILIIYFHGDIYEVLNTDLLTLI